MTLFHRDDDRARAERRMLDLGKSVGTAPDEVRAELRVLAHRIAALPHAELNERDIKLLGDCERAAWADAECGETTPIADVLEGAC